MTSSKSTKQELIKKYFTIDEAEELLPRLERVLRRTIKLNKALDLLSSIEIEVYDDDYDNLKRITKLNKQFHKLSHEFYASIEKIEDIGGIIKDLETGIIDFYSKFEGREIFLCWKLGERKIRFWHEVDSGYEGRKPILDLNRKI
ncbi:DUF2203 domain-containing protein [Candidatus Woesearchaeota archaeon]|nr:DUF2203 domain-containing protein [Candidatus Woesearchaeota archaeon]